MKVKLPLKAIDPMGEPGGLKRIGGSQSDIWNNLIVGQVVQTLWTKNSDPEERKRQYEGTISALIAISPRDEIEGMIATQLMAAHNASMECFRRAMIWEQTFEGRRENLNSSEQTIPHVFSFVGGSQSPPRQRSAKGDCRTHPRPSRRTGHCRQCAKPGGWANIESRGTTPCTWTCN